MSEKSAGDSQQVRQRNWNSISVVAQPVADESRLRINKESSSIEIVAVLNIRLEKSKIDSESFSREFSSRTRYDLRRQIHFATIFYQPRILHNKAELRSYRLRQRSSHLNSWIRLSATSSIGRRGKSEEKFADLHFRSSVIGEGTGKGLIEYQFESIYQRFSPISYSKIRRSQKANEKTPESDKFRGNIKKFYQRLLNISFEWQQTIVKASANGASEKNVLRRQWTAYENINNLIESSFLSKWLRHIWIEFLPSLYPAHSFFNQLSQYDIHLHNLSKSFLRSAFALAI